MFRGIIMAAIVYLAFGMPANAGRLERQVIEVQAWSAQQCPSDDCKIEAKKLITRTQSLAARIAAYNSAPTEAEYAAIKRDGNDLANDGDRWAAKYHIVPTEVVSQQTK